MKSVMKKALAFVMMLAMVAAVLVVPNVDAKADENVTIYVQSPSDWEATNLYVWGGSEELGAWPGTAMTKGADGWYAITVTTAATGGVVNNGNGVQSVDVTLTGVDTWITLTDVNGEGKYEVTTSTTNPNPTTPDAGTTTPDAGTTTPDAGTTTPDAGTSDETIKETSDGSMMVVYAMILVAGLGVIAIASKKRFA